eukprot:TRINITY_DN75463_c0_g1_i1.p1 TRINITY_DN75463_c0_g1~~TRINITY_DN75463_c0_g1_i1.p1  ORF type:complete len:357 (+),score=94.52 TRINITY_DN75463_c0_g1_i1:117-1187(+)
MLVGSNVSNVVVKNTFLDVEEDNSPCMRKERRVHTTGAGSDRVAADDDDEGDCLQFGRVWSDASRSSETSTLASQDGDAKPVAKPGLPEDCVLPVVVKRTFLDFEDGLAVRDPRRTKTAGAPRDLPRDLDLEEHDEDELPFGHSSSENSCLSSFRSDVNAAQRLHLQQSASVGGGDAAGTAAAAAISPRLQAEQCQPVVGREGKLDAAPRTSIHDIVEYNWTIDAKKLRGNDRSVVSRPFELSMDGANVPFKIMLYAKAFSGDMGGRGGQSFKVARGQGSLQLKCEQDLGKARKGRVALRFSVGKGTSSASERIMHHDFSQSASCSSQDWDFSKAVEAKSQTFVVSVKIFPEQNDV